MATQEAVNTQLAALMKELEGTSRRRRQEVAHRLALVAKADPSRLLPYLDQLVETLSRPEAQTRWEILSALSEMCDDHAAELEPAFEEAEASLFDDDSATVRLAAFIFMCRFGQTSKERSDRVWPLLDEAIQCYHGDAEYRDMLQALLTMVQTCASDETKAALAERVAFDAANGTGYIKIFSAQIAEACK